MSRVEWLEISLFRRGPEALGCRVWEWNVPIYYILGGGFILLIIFTPDLGEMIQFDDHIFQMGWFNHQLDIAMGHFRIFLGKAFFER